MKKLLLLTVICLGFVSCNTNTTVEYTSTEINGTPMKTYVIDSCQYVGSAVGFQAGLLTHKGNCKFCIERNKK